MRPQTNRSTGLPGPGPSYSPPKTLAGTAVVAALIVAAVLAASYPGVVVATVALAVGTKYVLREVQHVRKNRRQEGRSHRVCVPGTDACVEV